MIIRNGKSENKPTTNLGKEHVFKRSMCKSLTGRDQVSRGLAYYSRCKCSIETYRISIDKSQSFVSRSRILLNSDRRRVSLSGQASECHVTLRGNSYSLISFLYRQYLELLE